MTSFSPDASSFAIANPACYIVQKVLALQGRAAQKRGKDLLYIHDTFLLFATALPAVQKAWRRVSVSMHPTHVARFHERAHSLFGNVTDVARNAARIASTRAPRPSAEEILAGCRVGYRAVFEE